MSTPLTGRAVRNMRVTAIPVSVIILPVIVAGPA
jgi:hypothetical protein